MTQERRYSQEEVSAILRRALEQKDLVEEVSHHELLETAKEVGIEPADLEAAIAEERRERALRTERERWLDERRARLQRAAISWAVINALCFVINWFVGPPWWFVFVLVPWGLAVALQALRVRQGPTSAELQRQQERRLRRLRRQEMRARFEQGAQVLGEVVEQGVNALLARLEEQHRLAAGRPRKRELPSDRDDAGRSRR